VSRRAATLLAELFFTASALGLLFLVYQLWFTTEVAKIEQMEVAADIVAQIETTEQQADLQLTPTLIETETITGVGLLYIPRLQDQVWGLTIVSGTDAKALSLGVGHYSKTELPGETGNFSIAGHRATNGEPFAYFEKLEPGDLVYVQTNSGWFTYERLQNQKIQETEVWVLDDDPIGLGEQKLITLTTCDPRWNSTRRWAWWGVLLESSSQAPIEVMN